MLHKLSVLAYNSMAVERGSTSVVLPDQCWEKKKVVRHRVESFLWEEINTCTYFCYPTADEECEVIDYLCLYVKSCITYYSTRVSHWISRVGSVSKWPPHWLYYVINMYISYRLVHFAYMYMYTYGCSWALPIILRLLTLAVVLLEFETAQHWKCQLVIPW